MIRNNIHQEIILPIFKPHSSTRVMVPIILVFPSLSNTVSPAFTNSGWYLNLNKANPRSSFLNNCSYSSLSLNIFIKVAVCCTVPQCNTPSYPGLMVVEWWSTCNSVSNYIIGWGLFSWFTITIPLLISFLMIFSLALTAFTHKQAKSPLTAVYTRVLETWIDFIDTCLKFLTLSGPMRHTWFNLATPDLTIPDRINPTPSTTKLSLISNSKGCLSSSSIVGVLTYNLEIKLTRMSNPILLTLETGKIGQMVPEGIISTVFSISCI